MILVLTSCSLIETLGHGEDHILNFIVLQWITRVVNLNSNSMHSDVEISKEEMTFRNGVGMALLSGNSDNVGLFSLFYRKKITNKNIGCDPSLEHSRRDCSNDESQHIFS